MRPEPKTSTRCDQEKNSKVKKRKTKRNQKATPCTGKCTNATD